MRAKKFISIILSLLIACSSFAGLTVFAEETNKNERTKDVASVGADVSDKYSVATSDEAEQDQSGTTGDCTWTYVASTKTLTISGDGEMGDYDWDFDCPWYDIIHDIKNVVIENGVKSIGKRAFRECTDLTSVTIGDSVISIAENVFSDCTSLIKIEVNENNQAYSSLNGDLYDKSQTELIKYSVDKKDTSFTIPNSVTSIGDLAFYCCTSLTDVTIPDSVTSIGDHAFSNCLELTGVSIGNGVTKIGEGAFHLCESLTGVTIPDSVTKIGEGAFYECHSLIKIEVNENNQEYSSLNGDLYDKTQIKFIQYAIGKEDKSFQIPDSVTSIGRYAFSQCTSLTGVTIPDSVTSIGHDAFSQCTSLTGVTIPDSVTSIGDYAFSWCTSLTDVTIGDGVTSIGHDAFIGCTSLTGVTIPDSVTSIGDYVFRDCTSLSDVTIGDSVTSIGHDAFIGCTSLTGVTIPDSVTSIGDYAFSYCTSLTDVTIGDGVTSIGYYAFFDCTSLSDVTIGDSVTSIEDSAFGYYYDKDYNKEKVKDFTIYGYNGTSAEVYANDNEFNFVSLGIAKSEQTITGVESKYDVTYGDKPFSLNAKGETALTYTSDNTSVAEVSSDGIVTIKGAGKATITITAEETASYKSATTSVEITVNKASQEVSVDKLDYKLTYGAKSFNLNAKAETELSYISDNTSVAEVSADGTVTIKGAGKATITITAEETANYNSATATVEITVGKASQKVTGFESKYEVTFGDEPISLNAKGETALSYVSDNTSVADVSADGTVTIKGAGKATITITAEETTNYNSATATVEITVNKSGQEVSVAKQNYKLTYGAKQFSLNAKAETALSYVSSNPKVAYVSADGTVTIKGAGTATITITAEETENYISATATVKITVAKATQKVTGVKSQYVTSAGKTFTLKPKAKTKLTYSSSNKNVAVVSSTGKVTVKAGGYAYITVKASENGNYKSAYVKTKIISAPRNFTSKDISKVKKTGTTKAKITWKSLAGATGYTVQMSTNKTFKGAKTVKNSKNTATLTGLKKGKTYYVRISAYSKVSGKNYSNKWYTVKFKM